jgi:hypothetical protein
MTLQELVAEFALAKPYLVRSDMRPGIGSTPNQRIVWPEVRPVATYFGAKSDSRKAMQLKRENPTEYTRLKGLARERGLIA